MHAAADRLEIRIPSEEKGLPARAAQLEGVKLTLMLYLPLDTGAQALAFLRGKH